MSRALGLLPVGKRREASRSKETASAVSLHLAHGNSSRSGVLRLTARLAPAGTRGPGLLRRDFGHWVSLHTPGSEFPQPNVDPLTHSVLGIACALVATRKPENRRAAALAGLAAGTLPDADIFLKSPGDPLFALEYHRHFTHSFAFSPVIMLLGAGAAWLLLRTFRRQVEFRSLMVPALIAVWGHILCDLWTSYGTRVFWPFSQDRLALDWISVIDPLLTLPLAVLALWAIFRKSRSMAAAGLGWAGIYLTLCVVQQHRAAATLENWIASRGHTADRVLVKPSFGNIIVWRGLYLADGHYHAAAIRAGRPGDVRLIPGESVPFLAGPAADFRDWQGLPANSTAVRDVRRFYHFSSEWVSWHPDAVGDVLGDLRYAQMPGDFRPLWGIEFDRAEPQKHVDWLTFRSLNRTTFAPLWELICGRGFSITAEKAQRRARMILSVNTLCTPVQVLAFSARRLQLSITPTSIQALARDARIWLWPARVARQRALRRKRESARPTFGQPLAPAPNPPGALASS